MALLRSGNIWNYNITSTLKLIASLATCSDEQTSVLCSSECFASKFPREVNYTISGRQQRREQLRGAPVVDGRRHERPLEEVVQVTHGVALGQHAGGHDERPGGAQLGWPLAMRYVLVTL